MGKHTVFHRTEQEFCALLKRYAPDAVVVDEQYRTEVANMPLYGFGTKSFTLSMIETALRVSGNQIDGAMIGEIIALGKRQLEHPVEVLDGVREVLEALRRRFVLVVATKGELTEQERKLEESGLGPYFQHIEIMPDKTEEDYARMLSRLRIDVGELLMVGNSVKSDIMPVLTLGGYAVHVPFSETWLHEKAEPPREHPRFWEIDSIRQVIRLPILQGKGREAAGRHSG